MKRFTLLCTLLVLTMHCFGQSNTIADTSLSVNTKSVNAASNRLLTSIRENKGHDQIAADYYSLAMEIAETGDYVKAESYMTKAINEVNAGTGKGKSSYYRELARIQEKQSKFTLASESYGKAADFSVDSLDRKINRNDAARVKQTSPEEQLNYLNQNATILNTTSNKYEQANNLAMIANTNAAMNNNPTAISNYADALSTIDSVTAQSIEIQSDMIQLLVASNELPEAIKIQQDLVSETRYFSDIESHIAQWRNLSELYVKADSVEAAVKALESAYRIAKQANSYAGSKVSMLALINLYERKKEQGKVDSLYRDFMEVSDRLIQNDSTLFNRRQFEQNEIRIAQLVQVQEYQDESIRRKNRYTMMLGIAVLILIGLLVVIGKTLLSLRKSNKQIALQSLRREMNPHFIFNSLNSVNQFIANSDERAANKYLTSYSNLMRNVMENSNKDYISLETELDQLTKYLQLERLRFPDKFDYEIVVDEEMNKEETMVPNMLIQPNVENAIWHGLRYKESQGFLRVKLFKDKARTVVLIDDNGIGRAESSRMKTKNQRMYESRGLKNTEERIKLLNEIYTSNIHFHIADKPEGGVLVTISW